MDNKIKIGSFNRDACPFSKTHTNLESYSNYQLLYSLFALDDTYIIDIVKSTNDIDNKCYTCAESRFFGFYCLKCLNYKKYKYVCYRIINAVNNIDHHFASSIKRFSLDTSYDIVSIIKMKVYNEIVRAIQREKPKAVYYHLGVPLYILLHINV